MSENEMPGWRRKFLANRMSFESILFERELAMPKKEKVSNGLLVTLGIWFLYSLLLLQWVQRRGYFFPQSDAEGFRAILGFASYFNSQGWWALIRPELPAATFNPPLYYLAYVPVLKFFTSDLNLALVAVNSFFMLVLAASIFFSVRKDRPNRAGWLGVVVALSLPFVMEAARRPDPGIALLAFTAALYACYIQSNDLEHPKWGFWFAISLGLGLFTHRFYWLYVLPLVPFIGAALASPMCRDEIIKGAFPAFVLNVPWYLFAAFALAAGFVPLHGEFLGLTAALKMCVQAAGLPLFALGGVALVWMFYSVFMPYEKKAMVAAWFWVPFLAFTFLVRGDRPELLYAALLPFAVALPVMTPHMFRKYVIAFVLLLGMVNQSGLVPERYMGGYRVAGLPLPPAQSYRAGDILDAVRSGLPAGGGLVGVYGADANLNADSLRFASTRSGGKEKFENDPVCPACPGVLIHKTLPFGAPLSASAHAFSELSGKTWFRDLFEKKTVIELSDSSKAEIYAKRPPSGKIFEEGSHELRNLVLGPISMENAVLKIEGYDPATGTYARGELFSPAALILGGDIYGFTVSMEGVRLAGTPREPVLAGARSMHLVSARISDYAVERYLAAKLPLFSKLKVSLGSALIIKAQVRGMTLNAAFIVSMASPGVVEVKPVAFSMGWVNIMSMMLDLFSFRMDFSDNPYNLKVTGLRLAGNMLEVY